MGSTPVSLAEIFGLMLLATLMGIGGGNGFIPVIQEHWVAGGQLAPALFTWVVALGHLTPGPKVGFIGGIGFLLRGVPGAAAALIATVIPTAVASWGVTLGMERLRPVIGRISLPGAYVIAGLIAATGWRIAAETGPHLPEVAVVGAIAYLTGWRDLDPVWAVLGAVAVGLGWIAFT